MLYLDALLGLSLIQSSHSSKACHSQMALCKQGIIGGSNKWKAVSVKIIMFTQLAESLIIIVTQSNIKPWL